MSTSALLERLASRGTFPGALLLVGPASESIEREARRLASRLLCGSGPEHPEGACDTCRRAEAGTHPDLLLVEPEGVAVKIDRVREAIVFAAGRPYEAPRRVILLSRAEKLGVEAANALLKALEEPGSQIHWILTTTRPEALLPTILSRCVTLSVAGPLRAERLERWRERGFSDDDSEELVRLTGEDEDAAERLQEFREQRERIVQGLVTGLSENRPAALILLAEELGRAESEHAPLLAEVLADAALSSAGSGERMRHRALAGPIGEIARARSGEALRAAALRAADAPPDSRRGNRRLHFEALLLTLFLAGQPSTVSR
ncbi:MAG: DNA polymerase III subunit [Acidobacteriota bacterium]